MNLPITIERGALDRLAASLLVVAAATLAALAVDPRALGDAPWAQSVWAKPLKFQLAMALQAATVAWALRHLRRTAAVPGERAMVATLVAAIVFETVYITLQGARGVPSHFNRATPLEDLGATLMASGAYLMVGASAWVGAWAAWRWLRGERDAVTLSIGAGFLLSFALAGWTGSEMGRLRGPFVQMPVDTGLAVPFAGWRLDTADLRIAHFFGVHAMQALPLLALATRRLPATGARAAVAAGALLWTVATMLLMRRAVAGLGLVG